jgi:hypothetical protein
MDPSLLIPMPDSIPVHWGWLHFFFLLTFVLHLLFMNAMLGTGIIALVKSLKGTQQDLPIAKEISLKLPYTIAFTINMGVAPLLFIQVLYGNFIYTSSVLMGWYWLSIIGILIIAYYSAYLFDFKFDTLGSTRSIFIAVCVILMLLTAFLFTSNITLMLTPEKWPRYFSNAGGTILNLSEPTLIPRYLHFVCASIAVGGLFLAIVGKIKAKKRKIGKVNDNFEEMVSSGMKWFSYATLVQIVIGFWFAFSIPTDIILLFLGGSNSATLLLLCGLTGAGTALFFGFKQRVWPSTGAVVFTIVVMVLIRDMVRTAYIKPYFTLSDLKVEPQYSPMILFIVTLIIGIGLIGYMLKLATNQRKVS